MDFLLVGLLRLFEPINLACLLIGMIIGLVFGIIPGLQQVTALSIMLPFTFAMAPTHAFILMTSIYCSGIFGGAITAILYGIPGAPENAPTVFDGFALTKKGQAAKALGVAITCSAIGGLASAIIFVMASRKLAIIALAFGPPEYFSLVFFALTMVALMGSSLVKSIISALLGLFFATIGLGPISGHIRFTFGSEFLLSGFDFVAIIVGVFAIAEVLNRAEREALSGAQPMEQLKKASAEFPSIKELFSLKGTIFRCSLVGTIIGIMPALGATVAAFFSYDFEKRISKHPEQFGTGILAGVAAPETANNATAGGAMIPLLTLGIPGSGSTAVMLGAFLIYGLQTGEALFRDQGEIVSLIYASMIVSNALIIVGGITMVPFVARLAYVPFAFLGPAILTLCTIGAFTVRNNILDVWAMFAFGVLGYLMERYGFSIPVFVLGFILGPLVETSFLRSMILFDNRVWLFFSRPFSGIFLGIALVIIFWAVGQKLFLYLRR